jgi:hypothetical protein
MSSNLFNDWERVYTFDRMWLVVPEEEACEWLRSTCGRNPAYVTYAVNRVLSGESVVLCFPDKKESKIVSPSDAVRRLPSTRLMEAEKKIPRDRRGGTIAEGWRH